jgi:hypothetical protein
MRVVDPRIILLLLNLNKLLYTHPIPWFIQYSTTTTTKKAKSNVITFKTHSSPNIKQTSSSFYKSQVNTVSYTNSITQLSSNTDFTNLKTIFSTNHVQLTTSIFILTTTLIPTTRTFIATTTPTPKPTASIFISTTKTTPNHTSEISTASIIQTNPKFAVTSASSPLSPKLYTTYTESQTTETPAINYESLPSTSLNEYATIATFPTLSMITENSITSLRFNNYRYIFV